MPRISSGKRYARAAFELALEKNELEGWQEGLKKIADLTAHEELMALLETPRLPFEAKKELLRQQLVEINSLALNLAFLLVHKGSLGLSADIFQQYIASLDAHRGVERAKVIIAVPLSGQDRETISSRLGKVLERKVVIDDKVDSSIIGGFIARIGDTLIDGSIRQRLETLKKSLVEAGRQPRRG
jgi:F-type H+-transporting ATPase subunit delta